MSNLNDRLTLIANVAVVVSIVFLGTEMRQNTRAIQGQTRDAITEKQMTYYGWIGTDREVAEVFRKGSAGGLAALDSTEVQMYRMLVAGILREFENSRYQFEEGLFAPEEFEARSVRWRLQMTFPGWRDVWASERETFAPRFRAEIDRLVAGEHE